MEIKNRFTGKVIHSGDFDSMRELVFDAINKNVNLMGANLRDANLQNSNLQGVNLQGANLWGTNLQGVNLSGAILRGAKMWGCAGNRREIKSIFISEIYPITYTSEYLQIGCELHKISEWWSFDDGRIEQMEGDEALDFWSENKEFIKMTIEKYPAAETKHEKTEDKTK